MRYSLRQLEVFLATAHYENVTRAAESLAMSQSAASGSLKELERQFDMKLFDRLGKRLQLSELGQQWSKHVLSSKR
jgi:DNA-binding transcriptional LysR family regulator